MNRRKAIRIITATSLSSPIAFFAACEPPTPTAQLEATIKAQADAIQAQADAIAAKAVAAAPAIDAVALVGIFVGKRLVDLPHPALRILGIVLVVGSELAITFLDYAKQSHEFRTKISIEESHQFQDTRKLAFRRQNGTTEEQPIGKEEYPKNA